MKNPNENLQGLAKVANLMCGAVGMPAFLAQLFMKHGMPEVYSQVLIGVAYFMAVCIIYAKVKGKMDEVEPIGTAVAFLCTIATAGKIF